MPSFTYSVMGNIPISHSAMPKGKVLKSVRKADKRPQKRADSVRTPYFRPKNTPFFHHHHNRLEQNVLRHPFRPMAAIAIDDAKKRPTKIAYFGDQNRLFWSAKQAILVSHSLVLLCSKLSFRVKKSYFRGCRSLVLTTLNVHFVKNNPVFRLEREVGKC